jgi:hypothetical protein
MIQTNISRHISDLVIEFRHKLLKRRNDLYEQFDELDKEELTIIEIVKSEIDRIEKILKLIQKNKL